MKQIIAAIALTASLVTLCQADTQFGEKSQFKIHDLILSNTLKANAGGNSFELKRITQALRKKNIAFISVSVYIAQVFGADPKTANFDSTDALRESLLKNLPAAVSMTFARNIGVGQLVDAIKEGYIKNGIVPENQPFAGILESIQKAGDVKENSSYTYVFNKDSVSLDVDGKEIYSSKRLDEATLRNLLNVWLGKTTDSGAKTMQEHFLKPDSNIEKLK